MAYRKQNDNKSIHRSPRGLFWELQGPFFLAASLVLPAGVGRKEFNIDSLSLATVFFPLQFDLKQEGATRPISSHLR